MFAITEARINMLMTVIISFNSFSAWNNICKEEGERSGFAWPFSQLNPVKCYCTAVIWKNHLAVCQWWHRIHNNIASNIKYQ